MSLLSNLATSNDIKNETDSVGGGGPLESGLYKSTVTLAYLNKSKGGALALNVHFKEEGGREFRQQFWMTSGDAKGNKNYYETKDGDKKYLPGFIHADALCLLSVGKGIAEMDHETKVINLYSFEAKAEVPTQVEVITDLIGQEVLVGLQKQTVDKRAKADDGSYQPTGETRDVNEVDKIFRAKDGFTTAEIRAQAEEASFYKTWEAKFAGKTLDRTQKPSGNAPAGGAPRPMASQGAPAAAQPAAGGATRPTTSLFC